MVINVIILVAISDYFINGYWWLFHYKPLVGILLMVISGYCIINYSLLEILSFATNHYVIGCRLKLFWSLLQL